MTQQEFESLAHEYYSQTCFHSLPDPMRHTPAYAKMLEHGEEVVPWIIHYFQQHLQESNLHGVDPCEYWAEGNVGVTPKLHCWGMTWVLLLMDITKEMPIRAKEIPGTHFVAWDVNSTCKAWVEWYVSGRKPVTVELPPHKL